MFLIFVITKVMKLYFKTGSNKFVRQGMGHISTPGLGLAWLGLGLGQIDSDMSAELSIKLQKNLENCE